MITGDAVIGHSREIFLHAPSPVAVLKGSALQFTFVNEAFLNLFGNRDIVGKNILDALPELESQPYIQLLKNVFESGKPFHGNEMPVHILTVPNGDLVTRYFNFVYTPYKDDSGNIEGIMAFGYDVTEQVEARKKVEDSHARFRNIVEQSIDPILILKGADLVVDMANDAVLDLWQVGRDAIGKRFTDLLPEMKEQRFDELLLHVYRTGESHFGYEVPVHFKREKGKIEQRYFNFRYHPYKEADGATSGVLVMANDVTEQVIAKAQMAQSEMNFRNLILQAPVAICVLRGPEYIIEVANERMLEIIGRSEESIVSKPLITALPEVEGQGLLPLLQNVLDTGIPFVANERPVQLLRNQVLETVYLNFVYEAYRDMDHSIAGVIAVASDVTEQVLSRQKIQDAEENARLAIELADLGTYEIHISTQEMFTSERMNEIWGINHVENKRSQFGSVIHKDDRHIRDKAYEEALQTGKLHFEVRVVHQDGTLRWVRAKGKVMYSADGTPQRLLGMTQDITEQKQFTEELSRQVEAHSRDLKEANIKLERSNEELEQFAYIASHDLQEPLRKIHLFAGLVLEMSALDEGSRKYVSKINHAATRMTGLIKNLLEYSRLTSKSREYRRTVLSEILNDVLIDYELLISQKNAEIHVGSLPSVDCIPLQMNQLFFNLLGNSLKFTRRNETPVINIDARDLSPEEVLLYSELDANKTYCQITFADNGIGFNQQYADKIFTIFQRLNEQSKFGGYGIGLALCKRIIANHNGAIHAEGKAGEGAAFHIVLPYNQ